MALKVKNLIKEYKRGNRSFKAIDNLSLDVEEGDYINIIGRSGSGKSTLLNMLSGLLRPTSGEIYIDGISIIELNDEELSKIRNQKIGFVPQGADLIYNLNVYDNIRLPFYLQKNNGDPCGMANYLIGLLGLDDLKYMYPNNLSGGEIKRVLIARAMINNPKVLIADEPTSDLDVKNTKDIMEIFKKLNDEKNTSIILVTHEIDTLSYGKKIYTMEDGILHEGNKLGL